jgi:hypothetical protein
MNGTPNLSDESSASDNRSDVTWFAQVLKHNLRHPRCPHFGLGRLFEPK